MPSLSQFHSFVIFLYEYILYIRHTSYPEAYSKQNEDNNIPTDAIRPPAKAVFLIPNLSVRMADTGESKNVAPTAADPTREACIPALLRFSALNCSSSSTNTVPKEFIVPNMMPLQRKLAKTTNQAYKIYK